MPLGPLTSDFRPIGGRLAGDRTTGPLTFIRPPGPWIPCARTEYMPAVVRLSRSHLHRRAFRREPFMYAVRLVPPGDTSLHDFAAKVGSRLGMEPEGTRNPDAKALWMFGGLWARTALKGLFASLALVERKLGDVDMAGIAVQLWNQESACRPAR